MQALVRHLSGEAAEGAVARLYESAGHRIAARRWRGRWGEIDLIARDATSVIFIEVKKAATHARAAERLGWPQIRRIQAAAQEFLDGEPLRSLTDVRFDLALVDSLGRIELRQNALA